MQEKSSAKPIWIWVISISLIISIGLGIIGFPLLFKLLSIHKIYYVSIIFAIAEIVLIGILVYHVFNLKKKTIFWAYITVGIILFRSIIWRIILPKIISGEFKFDGLMIIPAIILIFFWAVVINYLKSLDLK